MRLMLCLMLFFGLAPVSHAFDERLRIGIGLGARYAGSGIEFEYFLNHSYSTSLAAGHVNAIGGAVGVNRYFIQPGRDYQFRASAFFGRVNSASTNINGFNEEKVFNGLSIGGGMKWEHFEFTIFYSDITKYKSFADDLEALGGNPDDFSALGLSFGYQF